MVGRSDSDIDQYYDYRLGSAAKNPNSSPAGSRTLSLSLTPHSSELRTHSETEPYSRHEPTQFITDPAKKQRFLDDIFPVDDVSARQTSILDFRDLRYDPDQPMQAEHAVSNRLNNQISSSSKSRVLLPLNRILFTRESFCKTSFFHGRCTPHHVASRATAVWTSSSSPVIIPP